MIDTIIFDAEGVVIDTESLWDEGQVEFLRRRGVSYDREEVKPLLTGLSFIEGVRALKAAYGLTGDEQDLADERLHIMRKLVGRASYVPGFIDLFESVRSRYRTCIATAMLDELFNDVDARLHMRDRFQGRVFTLADVGGRSKPDPAIFRHAARCLASAPEQCLVIEDSPHGIEAARRAGMRSVGLATTYPVASLQSADAVVRSLDDLDLDARELRC